MYIRLHDGPRAKRLSWHLLLTWTRVPGRAVTWCNRTADGESSDTFAEGERTCESCWRRKAKAEGA